MQTLATAPNLTALTRLALHDCHWYDGGADLRPGADGDPLAGAGGLELLLAARFMQHVRRLDLKQGARTGFSSTQTDAAFAGASLPCLEELRLAGLPLVTNRPRRGVAGAALPALRRLAVLERPGCDWIETQLAQAPWAQQLEGLEMGRRSFIQDRDSNVDLCASLLRVPLASLRSLDCDVQSDVDMLVPSLAAAAAAAPGGGSGVLWTPAQLTRLVLRNLHLMGSLLSRKSFSALAEAPLRALRIFELPNTYLEPNYNYLNPNNARALAGARWLSQLERLGIEADEWNDDALDVLRRKSPHAARVLALLPNTQLVDEELHANFDFEKR